MSDGTDRVQQSKDHIQQAERTINRARFKAAVFAVVVAALLLASSVIVVVQQTQQRARSQQELRNLLPIANFVSQLQNPLSAYNKNADKSTQALVAGISAQIATCNENHSDRERAIVQKKPMPPLVKGCPTVDGV